MIQTYNAGAQTHKVATCFTQTQYAAVMAAAQMQETTPHEWIRAAVLAGVRRPTPRCLADEYPSNLRTILNLALKVLTDGGRLDRQQLTAIKHRTGPSLRDTSTIGPSREDEEEDEHVAVAALVGCPYILAWNITHLGNPLSYQLLNKILREAHYATPQIGTPAQFLDSPPFWAANCRY